MGPGRPLRSLARMQALTLEVIQRVIFGSRDPELRDALRAALDMTGSTARLIAMSLAAAGPRRPQSRTAASCGAVERIDALLYERIDDAGGGDSILDTLKATGATREELRDQLVTLLAAGHETTATALAWALERLARNPQTGRCTTTRTLDATVKEVLRTRPVLSITARRVLKPYTLGEYTLPAGVYVAPCLYLAHRRADAWPDPTRVRPAAVPERRARALQLRPVRRRHAPLPRRRVRRAGDARGTARGDRALHPAP